MMLKKLKAEKSWAYKYGDNMITLQVNRLGMELIVNGQVQDKKQALLAAGTPYLKGQLESGEIIIAYSNDDDRQVVDIEQYAWSVIVGPKLNEIATSDQ